MKHTIGDLKNLNGSNGSNKVSLYAPPIAVTNPGINPYQIDCGSFILYLTILFTSKV
jgi:hypothetical protein